ncbi:MAG: sensor histidine kinase [Paracoccaceae bacterium]
MKLALKPTLSLRARLTLIILVPLMLIGLIMGFWAVRDASLRAAERFDRSLLSTTLAISRDTALSGGDALSRETRDLLRDTSGGRVYYHVYAPDGVYVTGYATPPVAPAETLRLALTENRSQVYFDAVYQNRPVRALRYVDAMSIDGLSGNFTFTVWQDLALRDSYVLEPARRSVTVIATLLVALFLIVWFGVRLGLRPLVDLQSAIGQRSPTELGAIRRPVPIEVSGIVLTLNRLLGELRGAIRAKDDFISNAAHQLRNPIAGVLAMAQAVSSARDMDTVRTRSAALLEAARDVSDLANALLAFERARGLNNAALMQRVDLVDLCRRVHQTALPRFEGESVALTLALPDHPVPLTAEPLLLEQALGNLLDNALKHGGPDLSAVQIVLGQSADAIDLSVIDDGTGMTPAQASVALERFGQVSPTFGSGIGLSIVSVVAEGLGGRFELVECEKGLHARLRFPLSAAA